MTTPRPCTLTVTPEEARVCPGKTAALSVLVEGDSLRDVQLAAKPREEGAQPRSVTTQVTSRGQRRITAAVQVAAAGRGHDYLIDLSCVRDGDLVASSVATVRVRDDVHLVVSSLELDVRSMSGKVAVENCTNLTPEVGLRLACQEGRLVFDVSVRAQLRALGRDIHEFHVADRSDDLGSCSLELVDDEGNVLDRTPLRSRTSVPSPPAPPSPVPVSSKGLNRVVWPIVLLIAIVGIIWWISVSPDDSPEFALGVEGSGTVQVDLAGGPSFDIDRTTRFELGDQDAPLALTAEPAEGWEFTGWSDGRTEPRVSVSAADSGIVAEFAEVGPVRLPDLALQLNEAGTGIEVSLDSSANGCEVRFVVRNGGGDAGAPFVVLVVVHGDEEDFGAEEIVEPMRAGEVREVRVFVPGTRFCEFNPNSDGSVVVDSEDDVAEIDEGNNAGAWTIIG